MKKLKKANQSNVKWLLDKVFYGKWLIFLLPLISATMSICHMLIAMIFKGYMDIASNSSQMTFLQMTFFSIVSILLYAITLISSSVCEGVLYSNIENQMRSSLIQKIFEKQIIYIQKMHTGEILNRFTSDIAEISNCIIQIFGQIFLTIITTLFAIIWMFIINWKMTLMFLIVLPILTFLIMIFSPKMQTASEVDAHNEDLNRSFIQEVLHQVSLFQTYSMDFAVDNKMKELYSHKKRSKIKLSILQGGFGFLNSLTGFSVFILASGVGAYFVLKGENSVGDLVAMIQLCNYITLPLTSIPQWVVMYNNTMTSIKRIREIENLTERKQTNLTPNIDTKQIDTLLLNHLSFGYQPENTILENVNIIAQRNKITAIIGESGSGKSTLLNLILGVYYPAKFDMIQIKNHIDNVNLYGYPKLISYVGSNNFVFHASIKENICMSLPYDQKKFCDVCQSANIFEFIQSLKDRENTIITENGNNFSMGQKQRIAIARALYADYPILIFDEPTANLDIKSVQIFIDMMNKVLKEKICIIVTHDTKLAMHCDYVYELKNKSLYLLRRENENVK